jgi:hypothetical protein
VVGCFEEAGEGFGGDLGEADEDGVVVQVVFCEVVDGVR